MKQTKRPFGTSVLILLMGLILACTFPSSTFSLRAQQPEIPDALQPWKPWVLWGTDFRLAPKPYNNAETPLPLWPSTLSLDVRSEVGTWEFDVQVFSKCWLALPGEGEVWPINVSAVTLNDQTSEPVDGNATKSKLVVLPREGIPSVELVPGRYRVSGEFRWKEMPQRLLIPKSIGIVSLKLDNSEVPFPNWDSNGHLWLRRQQTESAVQNTITIKIYRMLEDGIPMWLRTRVELSISGKSREEDLGNLLPEGWQLSRVESIVPIAVDEAGRAKVQVRPGNWFIDIDSFRNQPLQEFRYAPGSVSKVESELIGFMGQPQFRSAEIDGLVSVDVQQTTFPDAWRSWPVFQWPVNTSFKLVEKMRGMGEAQPKGFSVQRRFWLDDDGMGITYQDQLKGDLQQTWRLDAAEDHALGVVRINGERQLITANPVSGKPGVEIRNRVPRLEAIGRIERATSIPASGWESDADSLQLTFSLPPGWRALAVFGADEVYGDWLTAWNLLDLFILLVFSLAVYRMWGVPAGLLALVAFGLSYHEPGSPRWTWILLLMPIALLKVIPSGTARSWIQVWRFAALAMLLLSLIPFIARQVQFVLYPQLEQVGMPYGSRPMVGWLYSAYAPTSAYRGSEDLQESYQANVDAGLSQNVPPMQSIESKASQQQAAQTANLKFDPTARTQTGPALPSWNGNIVECSWSSPVKKDQTIQPVYLSRSLHQVIAVVRSILLLLLAALLIRMKPLLFARSPKVATAAIVLPMMLWSSSSVQAQFPDKALLDALRERLLTPSEAFPNAADITSLDLKLQDNVLSMKLEVHAAEDVAIPIPGKFPVWSPRSVKLEPEGGEGNAKNLIVSRREDGFLWTVVPKGVHRLSVDGMVVDTNEWVLAFILQPRTVTVEAPQWNVVGVQPNGVPGNQLFFTKVEKIGEQEAKYDQRVFRPIVSIERKLEIGLQWKVYNTVSRLSAPGKAINMKIPLLAGERVVSSTGEQSEGMIEVNLGPDQTSYSWESELPLVDEINLQAAETNQYVERWVLMSSAVWNITISGQQPIYEAAQTELLPVWQVWPGEKVKLDIRRPQAISGEELTVQSVTQEVNLGARQVTSELAIKVESSLGGEFAINLSPNTEVNTLTVEGRKQPVRRNGDQVIVPLQPGRQEVKLVTGIDENLATTVKVRPVELPISSANVTTTVSVPSNRWILWAGGPLRGPAVRLWVFLISSILFAIVLSLRGNTPLKTYEWILLALGLTQLHAMAGLIVVGWIFALAWRGRVEPQSMNRIGFNFVQVGLVLLTFIALGIFVAVVGKGLLGEPEMFVVGNGSYGNYLKWFEPQTQNKMLSQPWVISISLWYYRLFMLLWALWLASALLNWLKQGWQSFSVGGRWLHKPKIVKQTNG
jgi:hypothetical protein